MEGIMTGIKPREMFSEKGVSNEMAQQLKNVRERVNLIDAVSGAGASPLSNPLTQFLLQTGANLIGGESAGGTKLQEIVGATKKPLATAVKQQQLKDLSRRKLAATMLSKMGGDDIAKIKRNAKKIAQQTGQNENDVFNTLLNKFMYQDEKSPGTIKEQEKTAYRKALLAQEKFGQKVYQPQQATAVTNAFFDAVEKAEKNKNFKLDNAMFDIPRKELGKLETTTVKVAGKDKKVFKPSGEVKFEDGFTYYDFRGGGRYLYYDESENILVPLGK